MTAASGYDPWDRYWAYGNLHSFSQVTQGNYGGGIAAFWRERFEGLADGACVIDENLRERLAKIRFHPRTPTESLPFADGSVDLACSQFGAAGFDSIRAAVFRDEHGAITGWRVEATRTG